MSAFSTTDFATLLDEVMAAGDTREEAVRPTILLDLLNPSLSGKPINPADAADYLFAESDLFDTLDRVIVEPPRLAPSADPVDVARELGLTGKENATTLDRVRRAFAFSNHPDRVEECDRHVAIVRMQIANRLIDEAKAKRN